MAVRLRPLPRNRLQWIFETLKTAAVRRSAYRYSLSNCRVGFAPEDLRRADLNIAIIKTKKTMSDEELETVITVNIETVVAVYSKI